MARRASITLIIILAWFGWAMLSLFRTRFEVGDVYPRGSSLRSDALGTRALHDAISEAYGARVSRHRGRSGKLGKQTDATIIVNQIQLSRLLVKGEPLVTELTEAVLGGARLIVTLDDAQGRLCRKKYCNEEIPSVCGPRDGGATPVAALAPSASSQPVAPSTRARPETHLPEPAARKTCEDAALGLWGFEVGGRKSLPTTQAERSPLAQALLPPQIPWLSPAHFIELDPAYRVVYRGDPSELGEGPALVVERKLGKGTLVLLNEGYLLSNEAMRLSRKTDFIVWLLGDMPQVIFEESHLGVFEQRGIRSLISDLKLEGALWGGLLLFLLYVWKVSTPLSRQLSRPAPSTAHAERGTSTLLTLLRRRLRPKDALEACIEEAGLAQSNHPALGTHRSKHEAPVATFNLLFCSDPERPKSR